VDAANKYGLKPPSFAPLSSANRRVPETQKRPSANHTETSAKREMATSHSAEGIPQTNLQPTLTVYHPVVWLTGNYESAQSDRFRMRSLRCLAYQLKTSVERAGPATLHCPIAPPDSYVLGQATDRRILTRNRPAVWRQAPDFGDAFHCQDSSTASNGYWDEQGHRDPSRETSAANRGLISRCTIVWVVFPR
jgi:hypothetical protein